MTEQEAMNVLEKYTDDTLSPVVAEAHGMAITALEEIKQYRAIGTVEEVKELMQVVSEGQEDVNESGISTAMLQVLLEYAAYQKIGTVEECREAVEKQRAKKPNLEGDGYADGHMVYDTWICPCCGISYEVDYDDYKYCPDCGQHIDWSERYGEINNTG